MNIDRLILARIPDIAAVYGGARGRTMSSKHQRYAWPALVEAGVKRVIDLRGMDKSGMMPDYRQADAYHQCLLQELDGS